MSIEIVGFRAGDLIPANTLLRISLADYWYNASSFTFPGAANSLYQALYPQASIIPTTPLGAVSGDKVAVFDANLKVQETGADLINSLDMLSSQWAFVSKVERLTGAARDDSSSDDGTQARDDAKQDAEKSADANSALSKFLSGLGTVGSVVKWGGIGVAIIAGVYFLGPILRKK